MSKARPGWREEKRLAREAVMKKARVSAMEAETGKKHVLWPLVVVLVIALLGASAVLVADYKSTFLIGGAEYSTLSWLAPDKSEEAWTAATLNKIINNGDTHADIMARSTAKDFGYINGVDRDYWRSRLTRLRDSGIQPVIWLVSDDSPDVYAKGLQDQIDYNNKVVDAVDDLVSHYVIALEADEYYTPQEVSVLIQNLRRKGVNKPIGVHLTPGVKPEYYKDADVIYLQTGFDLSEQEFRKSIEEALRIGKPVVVSEYHMDGTTARARAFGDIACSYAGVVGTGNGRGTAVCGSLVQETEAVKKKDEWDRIEEFARKNETELMMFAVLLLAAYDNFGFDKPLPFMMHFQFSDKGYRLEFNRPITETIDVGLGLQKDRSLLKFNWRF